MYINTRQCTSMYVNVRQCVLVAMPPKACSGRQKKRRAPDSSCPCGCRGVGLSQRTVYRHLAQRGMAVPNLESEMADDIVDGMDIRDEDDPADDALADASDDNGGAAQAQLGDGLFTRLRDLVGPLTVGAMLLLLLVVQVRLNLAAVGAQLVCEAMVCTSLAAVPLLALRHRFAKTVYPSETRVHFCEKECVGIIGNLGPNVTCPKCTGPVTDGAGKAVHVILSRAHSASTSAQSQLCKRLCVRIVHSSHWRNRSACCSNVPALRATSATTTFLTVMTSTR
jgi:hypothetical protein